MKAASITVLAALALMLGAAPAGAGTSATNTNTVSPTLKVNVNVQTALTLTLNTGSGGCTISAGSTTDYSIDFGNVNGLGVGTPSTCVSVAVQSDGATYSTAYSLTPQFSGFTQTSGTVKIIHSGFTNSSTLTLLEGATAGSLAAVPTAGSGNTLTSSAASGTAIARVLAVKVSNGNGATAFPGSGSGTDSTIATFTLTVP